MQTVLLPEIARADVLGVGINAINLDQAVEIIHASVATGRKGYVCVTGVHGVMEAQRDPRFREILNRALLVTPDGMPTVWIGRHQGFNRMDRVFGPDLMYRACRESVSKGHTHFLYGGDIGVAERLQENLQAWFPGVQIVGTYTPPFRRLSAAEERELIDVIRTLAPDVIWVGMSTPKQEQFMWEYIDRLETKVMIGVGAAFDFHTGRIKDAPGWIKRAGLQWLHRLLQDPSRLWKRYLVNNTQFAWEVLKHWVVSRKGRGWTYR